MTRRPRLLVVDDKPNFLALFRRIAGDELEVLTASDAAEALALLGHERVDVIVSDVKMPGASGLELLAHVKNRYPEVEVILMTAFGAVPDAVSAMKAGAFHYLTKPFDPDDALALIRAALAKRAERVKPAPHGTRRHVLIASSLAMQSVLDRVAQTGPLDTAVLISGETGTGKEVVARELHARSPRHAAPFKVVSCSALDEPAIDDALFEEAAGGTLLLDEIAELTPALQRKVLRLLQVHDASADVRILAATSAELADLVATRRFREDLFHRLNVVTIHLPPLRERREDIAALADVFLERARGKREAPKRLSSEVRERLEAYDWPGNVRQLENTVARAAAVSAGDEIHVAALPDEIQQAAPPSPPLDLAGLRYHEVLAHSRDASSKDYFVALLTAVRGNVTQAAERAGIHRESLHRLLKRYGLRAEDFRPR